MARLFGLRLYLDFSMEFVWSVCRDLEGPTWVLCWTYVENWIAEPISRALKCQKAMF